MFHLQNNKNTWAFFKNRNNFSFSESSTNYSDLGSNSDSVNFFIRPIFTLNKMLLSHPNVALAICEIACHVVSTFHYRCTVL